MKYLIIIFLFIALINIKSFGQSIDESRMQKDIEVTEAILNEIFNPEESSRYVANENYRYFIDKKEIESTGVYIENYGVIFKVPQSTQKLDYVVIDGKRIITTSKNGTLKLKANINGQKVKKYESDGVTFFYINEDEDIKDDETISLEKWKNEINKKNDEYISDTKEKIQDFFMTYADLIGQLDSKENIMIVSQTEEINENWFYHYKVKNTIFHYDGNKDEVKLKNLTAEITKADLVAFKTGKMSEDEFLKSINYSEGNNEESSKVEYNVLAGVFEKLFEGIDFIYGGQNVKYERLNNFGIIYEVTANPFQNRIRAQSPRNNIIFKNGELELIKDSETEKEIKKQKEERDIFIQQIKEYMVQYGRTLRSLNDNEILMLDVVLNSNLWNDANNVSKKMKLTITKANLDAYDKGTISFEDAVAKVKTKEY